MCVRSPAVALGEGVDGHARCFAGAIALLGGALVLGFVARLLGAGLLLLAVADDVRRDAVPGLRDEVVGEARAAVVETHRFHVVLADLDRGIAAVEGDLGLAEEGVRIGVLGGVELEAELGAVGVLFAVLLLGD